jgi:hypothetical protein
MMKSSEMCRGRQALAGALLVAVLAGPAHGFDGYGEWRGQVQYVVTKHGQREPAVQEVVPLVVRVEPGGRVVGSSSENGCRLSGVVSPVGDNVMRLDVTLRDCESKELNRRLSGTLAHYPADGRLALNAALRDANAKPVIRYELAAPILRR